MYARGRGFARAIKQSREEPASIFESSGEMHSGCAVEHSFNHDAEQHYNSWLAKAHCDANALRQQSDSTSTNNEREMRVMYGDREKSRAKIVVRRKIPPKGVNNKRYSALSYPER